MLLGSCVLLFARLGHYSLWTDEASTAITAVGVWRTGDTSAWLDDHNLLTYRDGLLLQHQKDRYTSPLQFYVAAPFIGLLHRSTFACRLPFALCGLGTVLLIVRWLRKAHAPDSVWIMGAVILLTSESFFLFSRQCRYYALATFLATLVAYLYCRFDGSRRRLIGIAAALSLLLCAQYLDYAAVVGCLLIDYGIWGRKRRAIRGKDWLLLIIPQMVTAAVVCSIWNPIERAASVVQSVNPAVAHAVAHSDSHAWLHGFLTLIWWNIRDMLACDFVVLPLLVLCPLLYLKRKNIWLLRAPMALLLFIGGISFFTAHPLPPVGNAEVRYLAPLLPLCIAISILAVWEMRNVNLWVRVVLLSLSAVSILQSSALAYYRELLHPAVEPYTPLAAWINQQVPSGATIYVSPDCYVSPVMWNAPKATYVWQLSDPPGPDYTHLPAKYFKGRIAPDYLIAFGPSVDEINDCRASMARRGVQYEQVETVPVYFKEMFRPELIWRSFVTTEPKVDEQIYIFRRR